MQSEEHAVLAAMDMTVMARLAFGIKGGIMGYSDSEKSLLRGLVKDALCKAHGKAELLEAIDAGKPLLGLRMRVPSDSRVVDLVIIETTDQLDRVRQQFFTFFKLNPNDWVLDPIVLA